MEFYQALEAMGQGKIMEAAGLKYKIEGGGLLYSAGDGIWRKSVTETNDLIESKWEIVEETETCEPPKWLGFLAYHKKVANWNIIIRAAPEDYELSSVGGNYTEIELFAKCSIFDPHTRRQVKL